jgi:hypothetical protein
MSESPALRTFGKARLLMGNLKRKEKSADALWAFEAETKEHGI